MHLQRHVRPSSGDLAFQQTSRNALRYPNENPHYRQFSLAYHGDQNALRAYFAEALKQCETPLIDPEGSQALSSILKTLLARLGDERFARVLADESPRVQSAVRRFISSPFLTAYPTTRSILHHAPKIDFPLDQAYRTF